MSAILTIVIFFLVLVAINAYEFGRID